jgi:hypothetical protein
LKTTKIKGLYKLSLLAIALVFSQQAAFTQYLDSTTLKLKTDTLSSASNIKLNSNSQFKKDKYKVNLIKFGAVTGVTAGAFWWLHNYQKNAWWSGQRGKFHFQNDWDYAMSADKIGHFFDGLFIQALYRGAMEWSGFSPTASQWIGAAFSIAYMTDIEIEDGFATDWGFSPGDQIGNVAGALYPVAQYYWKPLRSFNFKWSYYPSPSLTEGNKNGAFLDDYNGQTMWLSMSVHDALPKSAKKIWPDYLNIAVGYGVNDYTNYDKRYADYYIGLDLDWTKIIPGKSKFMLWFKNVINHFRFLPLPVLKINKDGVKYSVNF